MKFRNRLLPIGLGVIFLASPLRLMAQSEAERLEKLERAVEQLQKRNAELESEVRDLKGKSASFRAPARETAPAARSESEGKARGGKDGGEKAGLCRAACG